MQPGLQRQALHKGRHQIGKGAIDAIIIEREQVGVFQFREYLRHPPKGLLEALRKGELVGKHTHSKGARQVQMMRLVPRPESIFTQERP